MAKHKSSAKTTKSSASEYDKLVKAVENLAVKHGKWEVFRDFTALTALSISNSVDKAHFAEREAEYLHIINGYAEEDQQKFAEMFALLVLAMEREATVGTLYDLLGELFHKLELPNKFHGHFFTPNNVSSMMGKMMFGGLSEEIEEKGYISVCEPCCGSGTLILGCASAMRARGFSYSTQLLVEAKDVDLTCVHMCYIQLSLYGIPAIVIHGNSLTNEEFSRWITPLYVAMTK